MSDRGTVFSLARRAVVFELRLYRSLIRWVARRQDVPRSGAEPFGYARAVTPVMWLWIFASAVEIPVLHLLVPWDTVRLVLLVVSAWGLVWMVGMLASLRVYPHLLSDSALRVRHGASIDISVPWDAVARMTVKHGDLPSSMRQLQPRETDHGIDLQIGVSGEVNVHAVLHRPLVVPTPKGALEIGELSFLADDPRDLVARARRHLTAAAGRSGPAHG
jgi:hypothetical protein